MTGGLFWNDEVQDVLVPRNPNYPNGYVGGPPNANNTVPNTHSSDPNGKMTVGYGTQGYIAPNIAIPYTIYFENQPTATAPAQIVTVTDNLDPNLDWTTVQLSQIEFNNVTIDVPSGLNTYSGQVNVSTDPNPVKVNVSFNPSTGMLYWLMQSVDPVTGELPTDPTAGFLPPNNSSNQGTGYVIFTVLPKSSLSNGAVINNQASIVFDANAAIATNSVINTIDATVPTSAVNSLPATTTSTTFPVSWSGSDAGGSGIANYTVYTSIDGGAYGIWQSATALTSATFTATAGHTYAFYSMATSNVGTVQTTPGPSQTTQILQTYTVTPVAGTGGSISPNTAQTITINNTTSFTVTPNSTYQISSVTGCGGSLSGNTYTTGAITANCTVTASFTPITFTVTPSAGAGGSITPNTPQTVIVNNTTSFTVTPNSGYTINAVTGCGGSLSGSTFTTGAITASCNVAASFTQLLPVAGLVPSTLTFTAFNGTTSAAQGLTLSNTGNAPLSITSISIGGTNASSFAQTNTCGSSVAASSSCTISVTFSPATTGSYSATVSVVDNAAGSPHTATLTGTATVPPSFTVSASPGTQTVTHGNSAAFNVTVTAQNGTFSSAVVLSVTGLPTGATATFTPASVVPGSTSASSTLSIQTSSTVAMLRRGRSLAPIGLPVLALTGIFFLPRRKMRKWVALVLFFCASLGVIAAVGCGGSGPAPQTYSITVTGTSGSLTSSSFVTLTVN